jgi:hypothetical protein
LGGVSFTKRGWQTERRRAYFDGKISRRENGVNHLQDDLLDESLLQTAVVRTPAAACEKRTNGICK